jgi:hypothetical protein
MVAAHANSETLPVVDDEPEVLAYKQLESLGWRELGFGFYLLGRLLRKLI